LLHLFKISIGFASVTNPFWPVILFLLAGYRKKNTFFSHLTEYQLFKAHKSVILQSFFSHKISFKNLKN
jgi:hypothetical protein